MTGGPSLTFGFSACIATVAALMLLVRYKRPMRPDTQPAPVNSYSGTVLNA
jgi:hypothetical protein